MNFYPLPLVQAVKGRARSFYSWRGLVILFLLMSLWGWFDVRRRGITDPQEPSLHKTDFTVYTEAGAAFFDGRNPYEVSNIRGWTYLYPPLFAILLRPLHELSSQNQVTVWFCISLCFCWGCYAEFRRLIRRLCENEDHWAQTWSAWFPWLGFASFCAAVLPTLNCLQRGQVGVLKFYLLLLGLRLILTGEKTVTHFLGGVILALPIVLKIVPALPVGFFLFVLTMQWLLTFRTKSATLSPYPEKSPCVRFGENSRWGTGKLFLTSTGGLAIGLFLFLFVVPSTLIGWQNNRLNLQRWSQFVLVKVDDGGEDPRSGNSRSGRNQSLTNAVYRLGNFLDHQMLGGPDDRLAEKFERPRLLMDAASTSDALAVARLAILAALLCLGIPLARRGDRLSLAVAFSLGCMAMLVVSPVSRGHYFMLVCPAAVFVPWWLAVHGRFRMAVVLAVLPVTCIDLHYALMPYATRVGLLGLGTSLWLLVAMVVLARTDRATRAQALPTENPPQLFSTMQKQAA